MQKNQIGNGVDSPLVAAHVQKTSMEFVKAQIGQDRINLAFNSSLGEPAQVEMGGGGMIRSVKKHIASSSKVHMGGGGIIHPSVANHAQK